jgi:hypothetical protein
MVNVIINIIVNFFHNLGLWFCRIIIWVALVSNMNQNVHLEVMPMHILDFVVNFHCIVFREVNAKDDHVIKYIT